MINGVSGIIERERFVEHIFDSPRTIGAIVWNKIVINVMKRQKIQFVNISGFIYCAFAQIARFIGKQSYFINYMFEK